jgi:ATP-dependent Clp protease ATP-binding subunit ClpA
MFERFTVEARRAVVDAQREAVAARGDCIGTEHLLVALLRDDEGVAVRVLRALGVDPADVLGRIAGLDDAAAGARTAPREPDAAALSTIGIDLDDVRANIESAFGPGALERTRAARRRRSSLRARPPRAGHKRFTNPAKRSLELALREALALGHRHIGGEHILLGLRHEGGGAAARALEGAGADLHRMRRRVSEESARRASGA